MFYGLDKSLYHIASEKYKSIFQQPSEIELKKGDKSYFNCRPGVFNGTSLPPILLGTTVSVGV